MSSTTAGSEKTGGGGRTCVRVTDSPRRLAKSTARRAARCAGSEPSTPTRMRTSRKPSAARDGGTAPPPSRYSALRVHSPKSTPNDSGSAGGATTYSAAPALEPGRQTSTSTKTSTSTSWTDAAHPLWPFLLFACAVANVTALWSAPYLPFTDLPQHAAAIATLRHWSDPQWKGQEYFTLALGADERLALFAAPLFWSQSLLIGFFNYLAALPLLLWGLSLAVRDAQDPRPRRTALLAAVAVALFHLHLSAFLLFAPAALVAWLALGRRPRALLWMPPVAALGLAFLATSPVVHPATVGWTQPM